MIIEEILQFHYQMFSSNCIFLRLIHFSINLGSSQIDSKSFFSLNYLSVENSTLNYAPINLLATKRLTPNPIKNFVEKF